MKLIDLLNTHNRGKSIDMYFHMCYAESGYYPQAYFFKQDFSVFEQSYITHLKKSPVEIDKLEATANGIELYLKKDTHFWRHYEPLISLDYRHLILNQDMLIVGASRLNANKMEFEEFLF